MSLSNSEVEALMAKKPFLTKQSYEQIDNLTASSHHVISRQATINIGINLHLMKEQLDMLLMENLR